MSNSRSVSWQGILVKNLCPLSVPINVADRKAVGEGTTIAVAASQIVKPILKRAIGINGHRHVGRQRYLGQPIEQPRARTAAIGPE
jgi:hypothetical protein